LSGTRSAVPDIALTRINKWKRTAFDVR